MKSAPGPEVLLPRQEEIDEEEHCSHQHQLCSASKSVESVHYLPVLSEFVCGGLRDSYPLASELQANRRIFVTGGVGRRS